MLCCLLICVSISVLGEVILDNHWLQPILKHYRKAKIQINQEKVSEDTFNTIGGFNVVKSYNSFRGCKLYWQLRLVGEKMADRQKVRFGSSTG